MWTGLLWRNVYNSNASSSAQQGQRLRSLQPRSGVLNSVKPPFVRLPSYWMAALSPRSSRTPPLVATGRPRAYPGQLSYRGGDSTGHPMLVTYEDGDTELMSLAAAQKLLLPAGTAAVPRAAVLASATAGARWQLDSVVGVRVALMTVMPGE